MTGLEIVRTCSFFQEYKFFGFQTVVSNSERSKISTLQMLIDKISPKTLGTFGENLKLQMSLYPTVVLTPPLA